MGSKNRKKPGKSILAAAIVLIAAAVVLLVKMAAPGTGDAPAAPTRPAVRPTLPPAGPQTATVPTTATGPEETAPATTPIVPEDPQINLGCGLTITDSGSYTGVYMEDGSNETVSDVMMIIVRNDGMQDVQLADIVADAGGESYRFRLTDLTVGSRVVLLELDRKTAGGDVTSAVLENAVLCETPMELREDILQITGLEGMVNVRNISDEDIGGDIFVYYKYAAEDLYYGGITFRVRVEGGLKAGEIRQIPAGHYRPEGCRIVRVTVHG